jgi:hypothetical protein
MNHQSWIIEEVFRTSAQIDTSSPRCCKRVPVQTSKERLLDHRDTHNFIAEDFCEGDSHGLWQRCPPSHMTNRIKSGIPRHDGLWRKDDMNLSRQNSRFSSHARRSIQHAAVCL